MIVYAIPDTHGCSTELEEALAKVDLSDPTSHLVLLGDYVDRGPDSLGVLDRVRRLTLEHPTQVTALAGNHEIWFVDWIDADDEDATWLIADVGFATVRSLLPADVIDEAVAELGSAIAGGSIDPGIAGRVNATIKKEVVARHGELIRWLRRRPLYYETEEFLFVHAGVDEEVGRMWKSMTPDHTFTEKFPPSLGKHRVGKTIVAGHVGVGRLHAQEGRMRCHTPYVDAGHIFLDGRVEETGLLNVMKYDAKSRTTTFL